MPLWANSAAERDGEKIKTKDNSVMSMEALSPTPE
jgi:hypothetical protein